MAVICDRARTAYFPVPKVACTSLKVMFWEINNGRRRPEKIPLASRLRRKLGMNIFGETLQSEEGYRTLDFDAGVAVPDGYDRVAVVRDPLARLHSAWSNKVNRAMFDRHKELPLLEQNGLNSSPSFAEFIDGYDRYCEVSVPVRRHTGDFPRYLGHEISWFTHVFRIEELSKFEAYIRDRVGPDVRIPLRNKHKPEKRDNRISRRQVAALARILEADYRLLGDYYDLEESLNKFMPASVS